MPEAPAICFLTLGCPKNEVDSDRMAAAVAASTFRLTDDLEDADVVVLNTCAFIEAATEESIAEALALTGEWAPAREGRRVLVAGCMPSRYGADLAAAMPEVDAFIPVAEEGALLGTLEQLLGVSVAATQGPSRTTPGATAYVKVTEGCDRRCSYCTIPSIRGRLVSSPPQAVEAEARELLSRGARELVLVGQDIASYGRDLEGDLDLASLLRRLDSLEGDFRLRLMYVQPDGVSDRLLAAMAESARVCAYLDVPLQHAAAPVLRAMGRRGSSRSHLELLARIRGVLPSVTLRTTVMTGFPGETAQHFAELEDFLAKAAFDYVGVFAYSREEGTPAAALPGQVRSAVRAARAQRLRDLADAVGMSRAEAHIGSAERVLIEGVDEDGALWGRTCGQAPDVDGITLLEGTADAGTFVDVRIIDAVGYDLVGRLP